MAEPAFIPGLVWTREQEDAFEKGASWDEVEAMAVKSEKATLNPPFVRPK